MGSEGFQKGRRENQVEEGGVECKWNLKELASKQVRTAFFSKSIFVKFSKMSWEFIRLSEFLNDSFFFLMMHHDFLLFLPLFPIRIRKQEESKFFFFSRFTCLYLKRWYKSYGMKRRKSLTIFCHLICQLFISYDTSNFLSGKITRCLESS